MSHATGKVRFSDGVKMYFEYNGTADIVCNYLHDTYDQMRAAWRNQPSEPICKCGKSEIVEIANNYADGTTWKGKACRNCRVITTGRGYGIEPDYHEASDIDGLPSWWLDA